MEMSNQFLSAGPRVNSFHLSPRGVTLRCPRLALLIVSLCVTFSILLLYCFVFCFLQFFIFFFICPSDSTQVNDCLPENSKHCNLSARFPLSVTSTISVVLDRKHNGTEFRCEAQLDLGEGSPPDTTSSPLDVTVRCEITFYFFFLRPQ